MTQIQPQHPYDVSAGRRRFLAGRALEVVGLMTLSGGLLLLSAELLPSAIALISIGAALFVLGRWAMTRSWDFVTRTDPAGQEPTWLQLLATVLAVAPLVGACFVLAGSTAANATVAAILAVVLGGDALRSLRRRRTTATSPQRVLDALQAIAAAAIVVRAALAIISI